MIAHRCVRLAGFTACLIALSACASPSDRATEVSIKALESQTTTTITTAPTAPSTTTTPRPGDCGVSDPDPTKSLRPIDVLPRPGQMPPGSSMADVAARGALRVGVDENTLLLSFRNPRTGRLEGFEIDLLREIAAAIFGDRDPSRLQFDTVTTAQKIAVVTAGEVDLTASAVTMTCGRWRDVSFSTPYYLALQKVLVRADAQGVAVFPDGTPVPDVADVGALDTALAGRKVCWTTGSTSIDNIRQFLPHAKVTQVDTRTDCLMALQEGEIDAVSTHDTFLLGYQQQDPNTAILAPSFSVQPYGIAVAKDRQDLVRFLNALILQLRDNGVLEQIYRRNFLDCTACVGLDVPPSLLVASVEPQWRD